MSKSVDVLSGTDYAVSWVYDGWNPVSETRVEGSTSTTKNFVWGLDLGQSLQAAGGIGGLIAVVDGGGEASLFAYDGNGNVSELIAASTGSAAAHYEYDAFGNVVLESGLAAGENAYRFSTKYHDDETGVVYYGYRFYSGELGRWVNRDPAEENLGGPNPYTFSLNGPTLWVDARGEWTIKSLLVETVNLGLNVARTFPVGAIGPVPIFVTVAANGRIAECKTDRGITVTWLEASFTLEGYGRLGWAEDTRPRFPTPAGRDRNTRVNDPRNPGQQIKQKKLAGEVLDPVFRDQSVGVDLLSTKGCACGKQGAELRLDGFVRGATGVGIVGASFNTTFPIASTSEEVDQISFTAGYVYGVVGASLEAGLAGTVKVEGPLDLGWLQ